MKYKPLQSTPIILVGTKPWQLSINKKQQALKLHLVYFSDLSKCSKCSACPAAANLFIYLKLLHDCTINTMLLPNVSKVHTFYTVYMYSFEAETSWAYGHYTYIHSAIGCVTCKDMIDVHRW